jgi:hypothetical protein
MTQVSSQPTPIGRRLGEPPVTPSTPIAPAPPPPPPAVVRAPGRFAAVSTDTPPEGTPRVGEANPAPGNQPGPRRARLYLARVNPWSVVKVSFMLSVAMAVVIVTAVSAMWWALDYSGVFLTLARTVDDVIGAGTTTFDLLALVAFPRVFGAAIVLAALEIVLVSVLAGLFAVLYNLTVGITGGAEVTFSDAV